MMAIFGVQGAYFAMAAFLILPVVLPFFIRPLRIASEATRASFLGSFKEGLGFSLRSPTVRVVLIVAIVCVTFAIPFNQLMPVYVRDVLNKGPATLGLIGSLPGVLSIVGGLFAATLGDHRYKGLQLLLAVTSPCWAALILSQTDVLWLAIFAACIFGLFGSQYQPATQTVLMKASPAEMHGRVNSLLSLSQGLGSVGVVFYGLVADATDLQTAYLLFGSICAVWLVGYYITSPEFRRLN
jgi:ENTS family enterobactin (siderophore) exporter